MKLDWTISVGNLLTAGSLLVGFIIAHVQNVRKLQDIETKLALMYRWWTRNVVDGAGEGRH